MKIIRGITFLFLLLAGIRSVAQISPGELSKAHAHLDGISNCTKCHVLGEKETTAKCLECHKEIKNLIDNKKGYHASTDVKGQKCASCHGEHFGKDFEVVRFDTTGFDHKLTGFTLVERHTEISCSACHNTRLIRQKTSQKKGKSYLGLGTDCLSCHEDYHQKTLGTDCTSCHNQKKFKPASFFNHAKTKYPLIGKHKTVDCAKCHKTEIREGKKFQEFRNINHENCTSCHEDVHKTKFGTDCTRCHTEESFHTVKGLNSFDHSKTNYPLQGKHTNVDCSKCHKGSYTKPVKHNLCSDCHLDYHKNQFLANGKKPDCAECHTVQSFVPSNFTIERHNSTAFKLEGSHLATPCFICHKKEENWNFRNIGKTCADCHQNIHKEYIQEKYFDGGCKSCHNETAWNLITFDHTKTKFNLQGKHQNISCRQCHFPVKEGSKTQQFRELNQACETCHTDIHFNQFKSEGITDCSRCHSPENWKPDKFDHNTSRFKLDGAHKGIECIKCHKPSTETGKRFIIYKFNDISCAACHS